VTGVILHNKAGVQFFDRQGGEAATSRPLRAMVASEARLTKLEQSTGK
jgi:hypothetical protein